MRVGALNELGHSALNQVDVSVGVRCVAERHDESPVVETSAFLSLRVGNLHRVVVLDNMIALDCDGVDVVDARSHAQFLESRHAAGLEELPNYAVWFC